MIHHGDIIRLSSRGRDRRVLGVTGVKRLDILHVDAASREDMTVLIRMARAPIEVAV